MQSNTSNSNVISGRNLNFQTEAAGQRNSLPQYRGSVSSNLSAAGRTIMGEAPNLSVEAKRSFVSHPSKQQLENQLSARKIDSIKNEQTFRSQQTDINEMSMRSQMRHQGPRKQGKLFSLQLGKDNGPFHQRQISGCPQVDKFATYGINQSTNTKTSPRIAILGASTYAPEQDHEKSIISSYGGGQPGGEMSFANGGGASQMLSQIDDVGSTVCKQVKELEDKLVRGYDTLQLFKEEADQIRKEIDVMMNVLVEKTEVIQEELQVDIRQDYLNLKGSVKVQRDENELLYKSLKEIIKQNDSKGTKIISMKAKINELEQHVGMVEIDENLIIGSGAPGAAKSKSGSNESAHQKKQSMMDNLSMQLDVSRPVMVPSRKVATQSPTGLNNDSMSVSNLINQLKTGEQLDTDRNKSMKKEKTQENIFKGTLSAGVNPTTLQEQLNEGIERSYN